MGVLLWLERHIRNEAVKMCVEVCRTITKLCYSTADPFNSAVQFRPLKKKK